MAFYWNYWWNTLQQETPEHVHDCPLEHIGTATVYMNLPLWHCKASFIEWVQYPISCIQSKWPRNQNPISKILITPCIKYGYSKWYLLLWIVLLRYRTSVNIQNTYTRTHQSSKSCIWRYSCDQKNVYMWRENKTDCYVHIKNVSYKVSKHSEYLTYM